MSDYFRELKPYINKLSEFNVWDSLFVIRQYFHKSFPNYDLEKPDFSGIENPNGCQIPVYYTDFLIAATLKYSTTCRTQKSIRQYSQRSKLMLKLNEVYEKANKEQLEDVFVWLKSYVFSQYKMQHNGLFYERLYKYLYLYSGPLLSKHIQSIIGVPIDRYIKIVTLLYFEFSRQFSHKIDGFSRYMVGNGQLFTEQEFDRVQNLLYTTIPDIKKSLEIDFSNKLFLSHNNSLHVGAPIIKDEEFYYCPIPIYILNSGIDGLQYRLSLKNRENATLNKEVATRFEDYVGEQLYYYANKNNKFKFIKEVQYNKQQNKSSDWIVYDEKCILFVDCKLKKLTIEGIAATTLDKQLFKDNLSRCTFANRSVVEELKNAQDCALAKDLVELGVDLGKIICCCVDWKKGMIPEFPKFSQKYDIMSIVLTLEETFVNLELKDLINEVAWSYVKGKKGNILNNIRTSIISSSTFDASIPIIAKYGIYNHVFKENFDFNKNEDNEVLVNEFLGNKFDDFFGIER